MTARNLLIVLVVIGLMARVADADCHMTMSYGACSMLLDYEAHKAGVNTATPDYAQLCSAAKKARTCFMNSVACRRSVDPAVFTVASQLVAVAAKMEVDWCLSTSL